MYDIIVVVKSSDWTGIVRLGVPTLWAFSGCAPLEELCQVFIYSLVGFRVMSSIYLLASRKELCQVFIYL